LGSFKLSVVHRLGQHSKFAWLILFVVGRFAAGDALAVEGSLSTESGPPNVILIMVDDLGYNDLSGFGHPEIQTPVLDQLARDGIRCTSFYSGASVCTPSRMALLTGCYPVRMGWKKGVIGYKMGLRDGLHPHAITMAEVFQKSGYVTAMSGKWHLGSEPPCRPHRQGFDSAYYIDKSNNQTRKIWRNDDVVEEKFVNRHLTQQFTEEAVKFIKKNRRHKFFLYLPYSAPHFPVQAHPDWKGKSSFGVYGDVVEEVDARIGQILTTLANEGIADNTIILFCSDNGPQPGQAASAHPFRGMKWSALEGGTRVPCIVRWTAQIPAGKSSEQVVTAMDLLPTLCDLAGIDLQANLRTLRTSTNTEKNAALQPVDGRSVAELFRGTVTSLPEQGILYWHGMGKPQAIRKGNWKLFFVREGTVSGLGVDGKLPEVQSQALKALADSQGPVLFNLEEHPGELADYSAERPGIVKQLSELAKRKLAETKEAMIPLWQPAP
jgi:arylsulfatase A-like enzyme